jgi:hypothetical protein
MHLDAFVVKFGGVEQMAEDLQRRREQHAIWYIVVGDSHVADAVPLVQRLANTERAVAAPA